MAASARPISRKLLELVVAVAGLFALLEMSARIHLFGLAGLVPALINSVQGLSQTGYTQPSPEPRLGFELEPNVDGLFKLVPFRTNSRGLRDREYALTKPPDTFRVAVLGSSFALPAGVEIERAFHTLLEERLSLEFAPTRYEFINFAVGMYNPEQVLAMLELRALAYQPDLLLVTATQLSMPWLVHDPKSETGEPRRTLEPEVLPTFRRSYPILQSFLYRLIQARRGGASLARGEYVGSVEKLFIAIAERGSRPGANGPLPHLAPQETAPSSVIERMARVSERSGIPLVLVRLEFVDAAREPIDFEVESEARARGIPYLDTRGAFRGTRASDFWIYELDPHPNWRAHELFAREIDDFLRSNGVLSRSRS